MMIILRRNTLLFIHIEILWNVTFRYVKYSNDLFKNVLCRENGVVQLVSEQVGSSGQVDGNKRR